MRRLLAEQAPTLPARRNKFGNIPVIVDGVRYPSKAQARRHGKLKLAAAHGVIHGFVEEVSIRLPGGDRIRLDSLVNEPTPYTCRACGAENVIPALILEDVKGTIAKEWEVKRRALEAALGIKIRIVKGP